MSYLAPSWTPPPSYAIAGCARSAWLVLGSLSVLLDNPAGGWYCSSLDLGYPTVRAVVTDRPDADGADDRTKYMGPRTVTIAIDTFAGAGARIDAVAAQFGAYMVPAARPVLHYVLDRPGAAERTITLRPANYGWPIVGADARNIQLQFVAADPAVYDPNVNSATAWSGGAGGGRAYNLAYPRAYPVGGGAPTSATILSHGDLAVQPLLRLYGPIQGADVQLAPSSGATVHVRFVGSYFINAGHFVDVDTNRKTAIADGDPTQSVVGQLDWTNTRWPVLPIAPDSTTMTISGTNTSGVTQVVATWQDRYLT
jgi:hypothetical protein